MQKLFKPGQVVLFQGDSVTDCGRVRGDDASLGGGYPEKIASVYHSLFPASGVKFVNRGVSGDRTWNLLDRYDADFYAVKPDFVSILIGINDTWRRYDQDNPTSCAQFEENYEALLKRLRSDFPNVSILLIEPFLLNTDPDKLRWRQEDLNGKIDAARRLARKYADYFLPADGILARYAASTLTDADIAADGVHPTPTGHGILAYEVMKLLGIL